MRWSSLSPNNSDDTSMALSRSTTNHSAKNSDVAHPSESKGAIAFGKYRVFPRRGQLVAGQQIIDLGGRAFAVLLALLEAEGKLVTRQELLKRVWPGTAVDEHTISVHISHIRRALGEDRDLIATDSGRGYRFTGTILSAATERGMDAALGVAQTNITAPLSALVGRETALSELSAILSAHRLVTLTGAGGIGKTRLAIDVARLVLPSLPSGAWIAELAPIADPKLVAGTIAAAFGMSLGSSGDLIECLKVQASSAMLLVLDNCEHLIEVVADLAEKMLRCVPSLRILVTSRETLGAEGEHVYRVAPLEFPPVGFGATNEIPNFSAVELFIQRVLATDPSFLVNSETAAAVGAICRGVDGIPLAIELAAARVDTLGVIEVAKRLGDCLQLLRGGRRTALDRHRTLRATLEWSYRLLEEPEQAVLRRLAIFANGFTLPGASSVAGGDDITELLTQLIKKSMVTADVQRLSPRYRILETTRAYLVEKLADSEEDKPTAARHAAYFRELLEAGPTDWAAVSAPELLAKYAPEIDNIRAALDWSFGPDGDLETGTALAAASIRLWFLLSLLDECRDWTERALAHLSESAGSTRHEMLLQAGLGMSLMWAKGPVSAVGAAWERSLKLAEELGDVNYQARALYGLWVFHIRIAEIQQALALAEQLRRVTEAGGDLAGVLTANRMIGESLHFLGEQARAQVAFEPIIESRRSAGQLHHLYVMRFGLDQRIAAVACQARMDWLQGFPDRAWRRTLVAVEDAGVLGHANSMCIALAQGACSVAALRGDVAAVDKYAMTLIEQAEKFRHDPARIFGTYFRGWVLINRGEVESGYDLLRPALGASPEGSSVVRRAHIVLAGVYFYGALAAATVAPIHLIEESLPLLSDVLDRLPRDGGCWCTAELLRVKGEFLLTVRAANASEMAEKYFIDSLSIARREATRSWELRTAVSLARLWCTQSRGKEARAIVSEVYRTFEEGANTVDLQAARALLDESDSVTN
jgi:predicted ATPase/DNA-binding winged helix-turn-helix (wHTH) protein